MPDIFNQTTQTDFSSYLDQLNQLKPDLSYVDDYQELLSADKANLLESFTQSNKKTKAEKIFNTAAPLINSILGLFAGSKGDEQYEINRQAIAEGSAALESKRKQPFQSALQAYEISAGFDRENFRLESEQQKAGQSFKQTAISSATSLAKSSGAARSSAAKIQSSFNKAENDARISRNINNIITGNRYIEDMSKEELDYIRVNDLKLYQDIYPQTAEGIEKTAFDWAEEMTENEMKVLIKEQLERGNLTDPHPDDPGDPNDPNNTGSSWIDYTRNTVRSKYINDYFRMNKTPKEMDQLMDAYLEGERQRELVEITASIQSEARDRHQFDKLKNLGIEGLAPLINEAIQKSKPDLLTPITKVHPNLVNSYK